MTDQKNIYTSPSSSSFQKENTKLNYWLVKLFNQEKEKNIKLSEDLRVVQTTTVKARQESATEHIKDIESDRRTISDMVQNSNDILMSISTIFPFKLFPTTINVEATRVTIITRQLLSSQVHSVDIKDISSVFIDTSFIFASLTLISKTYAQKEFIIDNLRKKEAILIRRIIEGLRMFAKEDINTTNFSKKELLNKLRELSETKIVL